MRLIASNSVLLAALAVLAVGSVGLKAAAGPRNDGVEAGLGHVERQLSGALAAQGFSTEVRTFRYRTPLVLGRRGDCRLSVRDARGGAAFLAIFASDAASVGAVRYLYKDASYSAPPAVRLRIARLATEVQTRFGFHPDVGVPLALATSPACRGSNFGLDDFRTRN